MIHRSTHYGLVCREINHRICTKKKKDLPPHAFIWGEAQIQGQSSHEPRQVGTCAWPRVVVSPVFPVDLLSFKRPRPSQLRTQSRTSDVGGGPSRQNGSGIGRRAEGSPTFPGNESRSLCRKTHALANQLYTLPFGVSLRSRGWLIEYCRPL